MSVPHSAEASASLAPWTPPQLAEFISDTRNVEPCADATAASCPRRAGGVATALEPSSARANDSALRRGLRSQPWIGYVCALKAPGSGPGRESRLCSVSCHDAEAKPPAASGAPGTAPSTA